MRLEAFRVENYKKIADTGWVTCRDLTAFVGKNEAGKSAIFRGLSKLNPSDGEKYDGLKEFPRRRFTDEFQSQDWRAATGRFELEEEEREKLAELCPLLKGVSQVEATRHYSWKLTVNFGSAAEVTPVTCGELRGAIDNAIETIQNLTAPESKGDPLGEIKEATLDALGKARDAVSPDGIAEKAQVDRAINAIATHANEEWQKKLLDPVVAPLRKLADRVAAEEMLASATRWVEEHLPTFVYFDHYDVIDSAVHIPTFAAQVAGDGGGPRVRTTSCLFRHVGLDIDDLARLGRHEPGQQAAEAIRRQIDERAILASSASNAMTQKFEDWWEQRKHKFWYQVDGDYFRIWVSDDLDPSEIELDQRSAGMQYFFSFYTVFIVEAEAAHVNSILLLDDPGLYLHGTAQAKVVEFLGKLSEDNQVLYTTHSPFMVDVNHLERARAVYEDEDGTTKVSEDVWPRDKDSLFPLQAALGYQLAQGLFISKRQIIVEGLTDLWLLKALDQALRSMGRTGLRPDVVIVPCAGVSKLLPLASMLVGHDVEVAALLDGDEPGRREGKKLVDKLLAGEDRKCLFIGDFAENTDAEIEDIFPEDEYLSAVKEAYPKARLSFTDSEKALSRVVKKVEALFERRRLGSFDTWRPAAILRDRILESPDSVADSTLSVIDKIYNTLNSLFVGSASVDEAN